MACIDALATISETEDGLTRRYLTKEHRATNDLVSTWMKQAGMNVREDAVGNVVGRYEGDEPGLPALMIGSHLDTVVMAGKYDGMLGVVTAVTCVEDLNKRSVRLPFAIEVVGFADEEGVRFQSTYLGSRAVAGTFEIGFLDRPDADGTRMADAMTAFGLDPGRIADAARRPEEVLAYVELHIEQGPVLEDQDLPVGIVTAIAGATRLVVTVTGEAGHAGTVPMALRRDAFTAASECVLAVEDVARGGHGLFGTVGRIEVMPGAANIIPGQAVFTVDLRAAEDQDRTSALEAVRERWHEIAGRRGVDIAAETVHSAASVNCSPRIRKKIAEAIEAIELRAFELPSGAGHDAAAMSSLTEIGMIFVRCKDGISHHPAEAITQEDAETGARVLLHLIENFEA